MLKKLGLGILIAQVIAIEASEGAIGSGAWEQTEGKSAIRKSAKVASAKKQPDWSELYDLAKAGKFYELAGRLVRLDEKNQKEILEKVDTDKGESILHKFLQNPNHQSLETFKSIVNIVENFDIPNSSGATITVLARGTEFEAVIEERKRELAQSKAPQPSEADLLLVGKAFSSFDANTLAIDPLETSDVRVLPEQDDVQQQPLAVSVALQAIQPVDPEILAEEPAVSDATAQIAPTAPAAQTVQAAAPEEQAAAVNASAAPGSSPESVTTSEVPTAPTAPQAASSVRGQQAPESAPTEPTALQLEAASVPPAQPTQPDLVIPQATVTSRGTESRAPAPQANVTPTPAGTTNVNPTKKKYRLLTGGKVLIGLGILGTLILGKVYYDHKYAGSAPAA